MTMHTRLSAPLIGGFLFRRQVARIQFYDVNNNLLEYCHEPWQKKPPVKAASSDPATWSMYLF